MPSNKPIVIPLDVDRLDLLKLHILKPDRYPFLLQSVAQSELQPNFDILFACPQFSLELQPDGSQDFVTDYDDRVGLATSLEQTTKIPDTEFLQSFERLWRLHASHWQADCDLPFCGGWFIYLGYELSRQIEPKLENYHNTPFDFPIAIATRIPAAIIRDHELKKYFLIVEENYDSLLPLIQGDVESVLKSVSSSDPDKNKTESDSIIESISEDEPLKYLDNVERIRDYIRDGDVFQVNLSRQWQAKLKNDVSAYEIYQRLRKSNPAPFFGLASYKQAAIISSSPERLVKVEGQQIETRPIAGTRPRGSTHDLDRLKQEELIAHPKERAEHIMLIDLERNDLGRVCKPGSVKVNELMVLESYSHVHHIVSNVQGQLRDSITPSDVIRAVFPGGTITGCPKVRCMEIIAELEQAERGPYTGSLGYVNHSGNMDLNILIRTLVKQGNQLSFRAGAGIVADSVAEKELEETRAKAKGLLLAL